MSDKVYQIQLKSPMGVKKGLAEVCIQDGRIVLDLLGGENLFRGNFVPVYAFQMDGSLKTAVRNLSGQLCGTVSESGLRAVFHTEKGDFPMEGVLASTTAEEA